MRCVCGHQPYHHGWVTYPKHCRPCDVCCACGGTRRDCCLTPAPCEVRHLNGIRTDNRVENLRWGTPKENMADKVAHGNHPQLNRTHCPAGHSYDEENTYERPGERRGRNCKQCHREVNRTWMRNHYRKKAS